MKGRLTYKRSGVDIGAARGFIQAIGPLAGLTRRKGLVRGIGGFGGLFELPDTGGRGDLLVASADGVGTKLLVAKLSHQYTALGVDLVAMNVNDILCTGAEPLFFLDYIACGRLKSDVLIGVVRGIVRGCLESHCVLLGGETAQMPLLYGPDDFDLAGFAVGRVKRARLITGKKIRPGQVVLGLASSGLHANGFTLVQRVLSRSSVKKLSSELLRPTRIYVRAILGLLRENVPLAGIAHITGGSFFEKIPRILPEGVGVVLRKRAWEVAPIFRKVQAAGVPEKEMYRTFNMGIGMVAMLPAGSVAKAQRILRRFDVESWAIGKVTRGHREVEFV
jgi:phosphoribosylformylglycinamidine cyclo-ligase